MTQKPLHFVVPACFPKLMDDPSWLFVFSASFSISIWLTQRATDRLRHSLRLQGRRAPGPRVRIGKMAGLSSELIPLKPHPAADVHVSRHE
jgi:hypothetical protein